MSVGKMLANKINDVLETKSDEEVSWFLGEFAKGLKNNGGQHCSLKMLTCGNPENIPHAKCIPCDKWFGIDEIEKADGCPDCKGMKFAVPPKFDETFDAMAKRLGANVRLEDV